MTTTNSNPKNKAFSHIKKNPSSYHHGDLKQALIETGLLVIREQGAHALSLREAARKAGVSEAAPYRHFANKECLLAAIAEEGYRRLLKRIVDAVASANKDAIEQLHAGCWSYAEFALTETDHFRAMFSSSLVPPHAEKHPSLSEAALLCFKELTKLVETGQKAGLISKDSNTQMTSAHLWGAIHGMTVLIIDQQTSFLGVGPNEARQIVRTQVDLLIEGMRNHTI